jgi:hypothetical protein
LIEVDPSVFPIDAVTLKGLKASGVSERVIVAMVRSARTPPPPLEVAAPPQEPAPAPEPQVVVIEHHEPAVIREVQVAYPVYIPVVSRQHDYPRHNPPNQPQQPRQPDGNHHADGRDGKPAPTVYWGSGGKLRPDAWKPQ